MGGCGGGGFDAATHIYRSPRGGLEVPEGETMHSFLFRRTGAAEYEGQLAMADASTGEARTFGELRAGIAAAAAALRRAGIARGDVVMLLAPNSVHYPAVVFGASSIGAVITTANPASTAREIGKQAEDSGTKLIVADPRLLDKTSSAPARAVLPLAAIAGPVSHLPPVPRLDPDPAVRPSDTAALLYSSGTTGASKGVILSHRNFIAAALQINADAEAIAIIADRDRDRNRNRNGNGNGIANIADRDPHTPRSSHFLAIPFFHVYGLAVMLFGQLQRGGAIVCVPRFDLAHMLHAIRAFRITNLPLVPPIVLALAKADAAAAYDLSSVVEITSGAAPIGKDTLQEISDRYKIPDVRQGYGMTETTGIISLFPLGTEPKNYATVGPLVPGMEAVVVDPVSGHRLPPYKQGELWVRGPNVMQGYLNNPAATASTLDPDKWLHTGDLVYIDDNGYIYIMDRLKELIKYKAFQVPPAELEALLLTHPEIEDAAVVPLPDEDAGEVPLAYVVRAKGSSLQERDVIEFITPQVAPHKRVRKVSFIDAIPKSSSGKILRRQLPRARTSRL